jgi:hypothetical protein
MMEAIPSFELSVLTRATRRNVPEDGSLLDVGGSSGGGEYFQFDNLVSLSGL